MNYTNYKDITDFYDRVRMQLGVSEIVITNSVLDYPEKAPMAEKTIKQLIPDWQNLAEEKKSDFESCIVLKSALLCYNLANKKRVKSQQQTNLKLEFSDKDNSLLLDEINATLQTLIDDLNGTISSSSFLIVT